MAEFSADNDMDLEGRLSAGAGGTIAAVVLAFVLLLGVLFSSGFSGVEAQDRGSLSHLKVDAVGGKLPHITVKPDDGVAVRAARTGND